MPDPFPSDRFVEVLALGLRSMAPYNFVPIYGPHVTFDVGAKSALQLPYCTKQSKIPNGANANFLEVRPLPHSLFQEPLSPLLSAIGSSLCVFHGIWFCDQITLLCAPTHICSASSFRWTSPSTPCSLPASTSLHSTHGWAASRSRKSVCSSINSPVTTSQTTHFPPCSAVFCHSPSHSTAHLCTALVCAGSMRCLIP